MRKPSRTKRQLVSRNGSDERYNKPGALLLVGHTLKHLALWENKIEYQMQVMTEIHES